MAYNISAPPINRRFVPTQIDLADFSQVRPLFTDLLGRPVESVDALGRWLADFSEVTAALFEYWRRLYINASCHTDDSAIEAAFLHFVEQVWSKAEPLQFALQKKFLDSPAREAFVASDPKRFAAMTRDWAADIALFRDDNVVIETHLAKLNGFVTRIRGEMTVAFRGKTYTPQQIALFYQGIDRPTRQEAWEAATERRLRDRDTIETAFDQMLNLRHKLARNAGMATYRDLAWRSFKRFDYTPSDCLEFADAIRETCVPALEAINARRMADLGLVRLAPWDFEVDPHNRPALHPFGQDETQVLVDKAREIFARLSPVLASDFDRLQANKNLDLDSRKGKRPGAFHAWLEESGQPFIFMNAVGLHRDVEALLHEAGHAFHAIASYRAEPLVFLRRAPMEFCEVASMSMELLGARHFDVFYDPQDAARAQRKLLEGIIRLLPWIAVMDSFQHWLYTHPGHSRAQRTAEWVRLLDRLEPGVDWSGHQAARETLWQEQLSLFGSPFYSVNYGIAQLGALQLWLKARANCRQVLADYRSALALGGTRPLPELFAAAGISFDLSARTLGPLINAIVEELELLAA